MWSEVNAMGTNSRFVRPFFTYSATVSAVAAPNHGDGPTLLCHTRRYGFLNLNRSMTAHTVAATSAGYGSPRFTTDMGREWAVKRMVTSDLSDSGYACRVSSI